MWGGTKVEGEDALAEDDDVHIERLEVGWAVRVLVEGAETDEVVVPEEFDFFASFFHEDIFSCQWMDREDLFDMSVGVGVR